MNSIRDSRVLGWLATAFVILVWGVTFVNTRVLLEEFSALEINLVRFGIAWAVLWCGEFVAVRVRPARRAGPTGGGGSEGLFAVMGFTGVFAYQFLENCAIYYTSASNVAILMAFGPVVTAGIAAVRHGRSPRPTGVDPDSGRRGAPALPAPLLIGSVVAIVGVALVSLNGVVNFELRPVGDLMALGAMVCWGVYSVLVEVANERGVSAMVAIRKTFGWALVFMLPVAAWGATAAGYTAIDGAFSITLDGAANAARFVSARNWINFGFLGVLASAVCFALWNYACRHLGVVRATIGLFLTPVVGVLFAVCFLGEPLTTMQMAGGAVILVGVALTGNWRKSHDNVD